MTTVAWGLVSLFLCLPPWILFVRAAAKMIILFFLSNLYCDFLSYLDYKIHTFTIPSMIPYPIYASFLFLLSDFIFYYCLSPLTTEHLWLEPPMWGPSEHLHLQFSSPEWLFVTPDISMMPSLPLGPHSSENFSGPLIYNCKLSDNTGICTHTFLPPLPPFVFFLINATVTYFYFFV